jgi:hypothetical protein
MMAIRVPPAKNGGALPARGRYYLFSSRAGTVYFRFYFMQAGYFARNWGDRCLLNVQRVA